MKIIYFIEGTFNSGGIERIVTGKANQLAANGHEVIIVTTDQNGRPDFFPLKGIRRIDFNLMYRTKEKNIIKEYFRRRKLINKEKQLIKALVKDLQPDIMISTFRYENHILPKLKDKSIKLAEIHFQRWYRLARKRIGIYKWIDKVLSYQDLRHAKKFDRFITLTEEDRNNWEGLKNIEVINNFIEKKTEKPANLNAKSIIAIGRLSYQKGFDRLIEAWRIVKKHYPDWNLNIYGDGPLKDDLIDRIKKYSLEDTIKIHPVTENIHKKYLESSFLVMSSRYEGMPMVMLEAMEAGLPIVSFDFKCGPKDLIKEGENGFLVKDGDIEGLANAIIRLIENPKIRQSFGQKSFEMATQYYPDIIMEKWERLFKDLINKKINEKS